ncbi:MAG: HEAT repeat domain-containing protein, partial [Chloroflexi bacterium]|nr:HEAT repeat domain-containing protein [Chloroflexota bacterium]
MLNLRQNAQPRWTQAPAPSRHPNVVRRAVVRGLRAAIRGLFVAVLFSSLMTLAGSQTSGSNLDDPSSGPANAPGGAKPSASEDQLTAGSGQELYLTEHAGSSNWASELAASPETANTLIQMLRQDQPADLRGIAISALTEGSPSVVPVLLGALSDPDADVRQGAVQVLGARHAPEAQDSLFYATFDPDPGVRAAAARALGELGASDALPRIEWMQVAEGDAGIRLAARLAENDIAAGIAASLGVKRGDLRVLGVAQANGRIYAATLNDLYAPYDQGWGRVGPLPDAPTALVADGYDGNILYLGTASRGMFRSDDGGRTWRQIDQGLPAGTFAVTAVTVDPNDLRHLYITLASTTSAGQSPLVPFGL